MGNQDDLKYFNSKALDEVEDAISHLGRASDYIQDTGNIKFNHKLLKALIIPSGKEYEIDTLHDLLLGIEDITEEIAQQLAETFSETKEYWLLCRN